MRAGGSCQSHGVRVRTDVLSGVDVEAILIGTAIDGAMDLIVLGTGVRAGTGRLFLGPHVEQILTAAPFPVIVLNGA